jgi:hypothetical protein
MKKHVTKDEWIEMYEEVGLDESKRMQWHRLFEARHPEGHQAFMEWLGIPAKEIDEIRAECR